MNINKFTQNSLQAVQGCEKVAYEYGNQEVEQEHLLYALIIQNDSLIANLIEKMGIQKQLFSNRVEEGLRKRTKVQAEQKKEQRREEKKEAQEISPEIQEMVQEGGRYITSLREANDAIPGEVISAKLDKLELIISKIFESVIRHPEQAGEMKKFMEYYLPTTLKLVNTYREFDGLPVKGENVTTAMTEIERTMDTIIVAFEKLLDDLFQDTAFDVSADISVLEAMFAREGYKESDF